MRREGFELQVSKPIVIVKEIDGVKCEPFERVQIDVPEEIQAASSITSARVKADADMVNTGNGQTHYVFSTGQRTHRLQD